MEARDVIGVVGAGVMGTGVAQCLAEVFEAVILVDVSAHACEAAGATIYDNLRLAKMLGKSRGSLTPREIVARIRVTSDYEELARAQVVIENTTERWATKQSVYQRLATLCSSETLFIANTSCVAITRIAALLPQPQNVIGAHFMNPVMLKPAVEVIRGFHTSDATLARCTELLALLDKRAIVVNDYPGFVSNRISHLFMNEAIWVVQDQVASAATVDAIFKDCYQHALGPLATADLIGLDTVLDSLRVLCESYGDPKFRPAPLLVKMVEAGRLGRKSGEGFYKY